VPLPLPTVKNGNKQFWEIKVHAANEKAQCALTRGPVFFLLGVAGGGGMSPVSDIKVHAANEKAQDALMRGPIFFSFRGEDPSCSQVVPQKHLSFIPYSLHKVQLAMPFVKKLKRWAVGEVHLFLF
jgi:hypothetical protein